MSRWMILQELERIMEHVNDCLDGDGNSVYVCVEVEPHVSIEIKLGSDGQFVTYWYRCDKIRDVCERAIDVMYSRTWGLRRAHGYGDSEQEEEKKRVTGFVAMFEVNPSECVWQRVTLKVWFFDRDCRQVGKELEGRIDKYCVVNEMSSVLDYFVRKEESK